jgi:RNA polymerase sigma-70 factor (sigma-E family)
MPNETAFAEFVRTRGPALHRYGYLLTGNAHDADDLVQDALIRLRGAWSRVDRTDDPSGYVRTTMTRLHVSAWRRKRREWPVESVPEETRDDAGLDRVDRAGMDDAIWAALKGLPPRQRAVIVLRFYERLTDAEIATMLGISRGTIRSQASRALDKLRTTPAIVSLEVTR